MTVTALTETQEVRSSALRLSPVDLEGLEYDLSRSCGSGFRYLSLKAPSLLAGARSANPHPHCGHWAFDIDGFVFVTAIPCAQGARARSMREAREVLDAVLSRSLELASAHGWSDGDSVSQYCTSNLSAPAANACVTHAAATADLGVGTPLRSRRDVAAAGSFGGAQSATRQHAGRPRSNHSDSAPASNARELDAVLDAAHYTRLPQWALAGSLPLTVSERVLLADVMDVMGSGSSLSYKADRDRLYARTGLKPSTATAALRGLTSKGLLLAVPAARGRFTVAWQALAEFVRGCAQGARALGAALTEADIRRRLSDTARGLAVPVWALQLCGATQAALLLAKAWAMAHGGADGLVWASGATLSTWLPGNERSLRRARAELAEQGLTQATAQYTYSRLYNHGIARNKTVEFRVSPCALARALVVRGIDFGADLTAHVASLFALDADVRRDAALWDTLQAKKTRLAMLRRKVAGMALQGDSAALCARLMLDAGTASRTPAPWRTAPLKALPPAA